MRASLSRGRGGGGRGGGGRGGGAGSRRESQNKPAPPPPAVADLSSPATVMSPLGGGSVGLTLENSDAGGAAGGKAAAAEEESESQSVISSSCIIPPNLLINASSLAVDESEMLGEGGFARVYKATIDLGKKHGRRTYEHSC